MWDRRAQYLQNYDGDTVKMVLDQGFGDTKQIDVRLLGVFAPEFREPGGPECREFVRMWFENNTPSQQVKWDCVVTTARMKVADREQKTLDRYVGTVTNLAGTSNLNMEIIEFIRVNNYGGGVGG